MEPKLEPVDEVFETQQMEFPQDRQGLEDPLLPLFPSPTPQILPTALHTPSSQQTPSWGLCQGSAPSLTPDANLMDEYSRVSELFKAAFARRFQQNGDGYALESNPLAIVPVPAENQVTGVSPRPRCRPRSGELVRVTDHGVEIHRYYRVEVKRTRRLYESLRIYSSECEDITGNARRLRPDLKAASVMKDRDLWLNREKRIVGFIPGIDIGDLFFFRIELCVVGLHGPPQAGIDYLPVSQSSSREPIATSIVVSGGYEDDEDAGDELVYTGQGGQDKFSRQCENQKLEGGNLALERSMVYGIEVRVIRGFKFENRISSKVYVYDGLYKVVDCWFDVGKSGFGVYKYKLIRNEGQPEMGSAVLRFAESLRTRQLTVGPMSYVSLDISMNKEKVPVLLFNNVDSDQEPLCYEYLLKAAFPAIALCQASNATGCDCISGCTDGCFCARKNGGEFPYNHHGLLRRGKPVIFECGINCRCPPNCKNRLTQHGLTNRLEVFRSRETSWAVRSLDFIHAGAFICEYAGVVLTRDLAQVFAMNGDKLVYPSRFPDHWTEWGDLSQVSPDYVRPSNPSIPPLDFAMDVSRMRNVACYMSHSATPNVLVQYVFYDHNSLQFPHLMLFAMENIPPLRELSLDYGVADNDWTGKLAICN